MRTWVLTGLALLLSVNAGLACGLPGRAGAALPAPGLAIDTHLKGAKLSGTDLALVRDLRAKIDRLIAEGRTDAARDIEVDAMRRLGFRKVWLRCGPGSHMWVKSASSSKG